MGGVAGPLNAGWRAMTARGFADLSPPEAEHAVLELPTNRAEYVGVLEDIADYPARSPIGYRIASDDEVRAMMSADQTGWRAVVLLDDECALRCVAGLFSRVFVLDPFYDTGAMLYAAWHDAQINDEHARRLAEHAAALVRAAPLLNAGTAMLAPDHLPGSWSPRPGWRKPRATDDARQVAGWSMRNGLVLAYWADRLDGVACAARTDLVAALDLALGPDAATCALELREPEHIADAQSARENSGSALCHRWRECRQLSRRRARRRLDAVAATLGNIDELSGAEASKARWRLALGEPWLPEPAVLLRRVLNGQDPACGPPLPRRGLKHRPLCLLRASA